MSGTNKDLTEREKHRKNRRNNNTAAEAAEKEYKMADFEKINEQELENAAGGQSGAAVFKKVANLKDGYLAVRTAPAAKYENEIQSTKLHNGDLVQITGSYVQGTSFGGGAATYVWVFVPKTGVSGYVNAAFLA